MKNILVITVLALTACSYVSQAQTGATGTQTMPGPEEQSTSVADTTAASDSLADLDAMTFGCPKAALNAAAREAAKVPSQGTYQFAYFNIVNDSHHSSYEIRFKSNYQGEPELKYCVSLYCQQGWDPKTAKTSITLMSNDSQGGRATTHGTGCMKKASVKRPKYTHSHQ
jgi:hypothetical protein